MEPDCETTGAGGRPGSETTTPAVQFRTTRQLSATPARQALEAIKVRVIEYALPNVLESEPRYRLMTTMLDPAVAPVQELAALYHARWHVESVFDELKTHLRQNRRVLRSKTPDLVRQEFYGWMLAH